MILPDNPLARDTESIAVLFKIISRRSWDSLQAWHKAFPGSAVEHVAHGIYVRHVPPGGAGEGEVA